MPYIDKERRKALCGDSTTDYNTNIENGGELNYWFSLMIVDYLLYKDISYQTISDVRSALENCASEFYDRIVRPYENLKIEQNGDIYQDLTDQIKRKEKLFNLLKSKPKSKKK